MFVATWESEMEWPSSSCSAHNGSRLPYLLMQPSVRDMPVPGSNPMSCPPKKMGRHRRTSTWSLLKCVNASHWAKTNNKQTNKKLLFTSTSAKTLPRLWTSRAGHWGMDCPTMSRKGNLAPPAPSSYSTGKFVVSSGPGSQRLMLPQDLCPQ